MNFTSNKSRRAYWEAMVDTHSTQEIAEALKLLPDDTARVLRLHYEHGLPLPKIVTIINRSISIVRGHHNRGIFKLAQYFERKEGRGFIGNL